LFDSTRGGDPATAIDQIFTPSPDYKSRNLFFCDQVLHSLHIEALFFAKRISPTTSTTWLTDLLQNYPNGWLRIGIPWSEDYPELPPEVAGDNQPYFEHTNVHEMELQIGDHLIVHNHPAYIHATASGFWALENALVVQTEPRLLLQGHGTDPQSLDEMKTTMIGLFNTELDSLRDQAARASSSQIQLASREDSPPNYLRNAPFVTSAAWGAAYSSSQGVGNWWLSWLVDDHGWEVDVVNNDAWRPIAWQLHRVYYIRESRTDPATGQVGQPRWYGNFPLWAPLQDGHGAPIVDAAGQMTHAHPLSVTADMVAAYTWISLPLQSNRKMVWVIRPHWRETVSP
jgi:hypothetical protein